MRGNSFGHNFCVTTFGESHGAALGCIIDGCPSNLPINEKDIQKYLNRRRPGQSSYTTTRNEADKVKILSGVFEDKTLGTPIMLTVENADNKSADYDKLKDIIRPGHGDFGYQAKYKHRDHRGGGRSSARETVARVAAGAVAQEYLAQQGVKITSYISQLGHLKINHDNIDLAQIDHNPFFCPDLKIVAEFADLIDTLREQKDSCGAKAEVIIEGLPAGLGAPVFMKLDAYLAYALMSIPAVKAVAIGDGFDCIDKLGSQFRDNISTSGFGSNHAGGILGGISTGQAITASVAIKPTSSIAQPIATVTNDGENTSVTVGGRHDPCVGIRAIPIIEAMSALVIMDTMLQPTSNIG